MICVWISDLGSFTTSAFNPFLLLLRTIQPVSMVILSLPLILTVSSNSSSLHHLCICVIVPFSSTAAIHLHLCTFREIILSPWMLTVTINFKLSSLVMVPKRNCLESKCYILLFFFYIIVSLYLVFYFKCAVKEPGREYKFLKVCPVAITSVICADNYRQKIKNEPQKSLWYTENSFLDFML